MDKNFLKKILSKFSGVNPVSETNSTSRSWLKILVIAVILVNFLLGGFLGFRFHDYLKQFLGIPSYIKEVGKKIFGYSFELPLFQPLLKSSPEIRAPVKDSMCPPYVAQVSQEETIIKVVKQASPAVVSVIISKDIPVLKEYYEEPFKEFKDFFGQDIPFEFKIPKYKEEGKQKKEIGGGTGFIISQDGLILTNKHVVIDKEAEYKVITNDGKKYEAKVLAHDPFQDLAVLKIEEEKNLPVLKLSDSSSVQIGQTVIAIGNALGEFRNTVSVGVVSGLGRTITALGEGIIETLEDIIQTDAAINRGNSGGPLLNLKGEAIGINVAIAEGAQGIGFAIPINKAKRAIEQIKKSGKIIYPFLGIRYVLITPEIQEEEKLKSGEGALVIGENEKDPAVLPGSAAEKAGVKNGDIILEVNNEKITLKNSLAKVIQKYNPGDKIELKILRGDKFLELTAILGEKTS